MWKSLEQQRRKYRNFLIAMLILDIIMIFGVSYYYLQRKLPDEIYLFKNREDQFDFSLPIEANIGMDSVEVTSNRSQKIKENIVFSMEEPFSLYSKKKGSYTMCLKLFGILPIQDVNVNVIEKQEIIPSGQTIGIEINTNGILVLGIGSVIGKDGQEHEPASHIVATGDYIRKINGVAIDTKEELIRELKKITQEKVYLTLERKKEEIEVVIKAIENVDGDYKLGIWVRDDTQGLGTLTYISENGIFGALGHGINDVDTGILMEISSGNIYDAGVYKIVKGEKGNPGEITGYIKKTETHKLGTITKNTSHGIIGEYLVVPNQQALPIALKQEIKKGEASILCEIDGEVKSYDIKIEKIDVNSRSESKGMLISIVDPKLLQKTNGIVQGMSGSPIIQDGKLIGAVTHVLVNDPTRGYGIFIENMLEH